MTCCFQSEQTKGHQEEKKTSFHASFQHQAVLLDKKSGQFVSTLYIMHFQSIINISPIKSCFCKYWGFFCMVLACSRICLEIVMAFTPKQKSQKLTDGQAAKEQQTCQTIKLVRSCSPKASSTCWRGYIIVFVGLGVVLSFTITLAYPSHLNLGYSVHSNLK